MLRTVPPSITYVPVKGRSLKFSVAPVNTVVVPDPSEELPPSRLVVPPRSAISPV